MTLIETNGKLSALFACNALPIKVGERRKRLPELVEFLLPSRLKALQMDSFFILSELTDKTRRLAPAQYEPQTEQSPPEPRIRRGRAFFSCPAPIFIYYI